ncbi:MAG TPA: NYN domain-containing protein [Candidatus Elarobacter sp.]|nr:NYN domain-containing protein [Candidatus Elarobacter sp.]
MGRVAIFIDGGYLDFVLREEFDNARIDYEKFAAWMAGPNELLRTYYYHCLPFQSSPPTDEERRRFSHAQSFFGRLGRIPRFHVREGKLAYRGRDASTGLPFFEQKRVDLMLGLDMALLATKRQISDVVLFSGDSDLLPAVEAVKSEGVLFRLYHGTAQRPHADLYAAADERVALSADVIQSILRRYSIGSPKYGNVLVK